MKAMCIDESRNFVWQDVEDPVCHGEFCRSVGADVVSNRFKDDLLKTFSENPPDVAIDPVGGPLMGKCIATMPYRGVYFKSDEARAQGRYRAAKGYRNDLTYYTLGIFVFF